MELSPGQELSHFRIVEKFDEGGMGVVYRARDLHLDRDVAIKVLSHRHAATGSSESRFRREALALSRLNHPNIASVFDFDVQDGIRFLVMEWIAGLTLSTKLAVGPLPEGEILHYGDQITSALGYAHGEGVIHRDLKPANLRITADGRVKILDFGLAKLKPVSDSAITETLPDARAVAGTLPYIAPEILNGLPATPASDVYSVAAVLYEMATSRRAFPHEDPAALTMAIVTEAPRPPRQINKEISAELEHVILRGLGKNPEHRYVTASEMRGDLRRITSGLPLIVPRRRSWPLQRFMPWVAATAVVAALLFAAPGLVGRRDPPRSPVMRPIVTWPSVERSARLSPDRQWIAFVSDQGGTNSVWMQRVKGGEPRVVTSQPGLADALWSPDGESLGVLVSNLGAVSFEIVAAFGGRGVTSLALPKELGNAELLRWYGANVYLHLPRSGVWRFDTASGKAARIFESQGPEGLREQFDVHPDEKRVAYSMRTPHQLTLWITDMATGKSERISGSDNEGGALFGGQSLFFTSDRSNQVDLWRLDLRSREREQITFSRSVEYTQSVSDDLSLLTFVEKQDEADLWIYSPPTGQHRQLTADMLREDWPSAADDQVAVQRQKPVLYAPSRNLHADILVGALLPSGGVATWNRVAEGGMPMLSPDGRRIAYARPAERMFEYVLHVKDLDTGVDGTVTRGFRVPNYYPWPRDYERSSLAWRDDGAPVFIVRSEAGLDEIRSPGSTLYSAPKGTIIREVYTDGGRIAFMTETSPEAGPAEIHLMEGGADTILDSMQRDWKRTLYIRGPLPDRRWVVLRASLNPDFTERAEVLVIDAGGKARPVGSIDRVWAGTAELDAAAGVIYFTVADESHVHNVVAFSLAGGASRPITNNSVPGISFAGFEVTPRGDLLYVLQKNSQDVWLIDFQPAHRKEREP
ncbi:MAG TPA: protein kinase [Thermoanaerobaculia bacterium]|nr:protein kinase [Thermoanaerobaculia bacterium]